VALGNIGVADGRPVDVGVEVRVLVTVGRGVKVGGRLAVGVAVAVGVLVGVSVGKSPMKVGIGVIWGGGAGESSAASATVSTPNTATKIKRVMALKNPLRRTMGNPLIFERVQPKKSVERQKDSTKWKFRGIVSLWYGGRAHPNLSTCISGRAEKELSGMDRKFQITSAKSGAAFGVRVVTRAEVAEIGGTNEEGALRVRLTADSAEADEANTELMALFASVLGVKANQVEIVAGHQSRDKIMCVLDVSASELESKLGIRS